VLLYTVKDKGGKPDRKPHPLPYGLRNPYRNLKSENSQDYAQKPQRNYTLMNSASGNKRTDNGKRCAEKMLAEQMEKHLKYITFSWNWCAEDRCDWDESAGNKR
jgi:hypothetical protein